jgi:predicted molibdopterin-dependent oxidoreductase YjgC
MEPISLTINGLPLVAGAGTSILKAARDNGIRIPTLCHHPHLEAAGACRLCVVEDDQSGRIMASCVTPVAAGLSVQTDSEALRRHRANIVRLLMANHPESCIVCNKGNRCELRLLAAELGIGVTGLRRMPHYLQLEEANPFIIRDLTKCILCGKCIRADQELVAVGAIDYNLRGLRSRPATAGERPLEKSSCTFCGTCVSLCPTGALMAKNVVFAGSPRKEAPAICGFCGVGCSLVIGSADGQIVEVNPDHGDGTVNRSTLCVRGHFAHDFLNGPGRLTAPLVRKADGLTEAAWEEALDVVAQGLLSIKSRYGQQSIALLGSTKCTSEENYLFQKLARVVLKTNNVDNGSALSGRSVWNRLQERLVGVGRNRPLEELETAEAILVLGADPTQSVPVLGYHLRRASRNGKTPVIVADPRPTDLVPFARHWLPLNPGSDSELIAGLASLLLRTGSFDLDYIGRSAAGFDGYRESLSAFDLEEMSRVTGLELKSVASAAQLLAGKKITFVLGHGIALQPNGFRVVDAVVNLALLTGSVGTAGGGFFITARENNEEGAWDMGTIPDALPGRQSLADDAARRHWERVWRCRLSPDPGLSLTGMIREAEKGNLKALFVLGENPVRACAESARVREALGKLELLVVQDILETETTRLAHVVLPGASFAEKGGSFTNLERRIQSFEPALAPPGGALPDWEILARLGKRMGLADTYQTVQQLRSEIAGLVPGYSDLTVAKGTGWVKGTGRPAEAGRRISFSDYVPARIPAPPDGYPFQVIFGSLRGHLGSGTRTAASARIREFIPRGAVEMSPEDGALLGITEGETVALASPYGTIHRPVTFNRGLRPGLLFVPRAVQGNDAVTLAPFEIPGGTGLTGINAVPVKIAKESHT